MLILISPKNWGGVSIGADFTRLAQFLCQFFGFTCNFFKFTSILKVFHQNDSTLDRQNLFIFLF